MGRRERRKLGMETCWEAGKLFEIKFLLSLQQFVVLHYTTVWSVFVLDSDSSHIVIRPGSSSEITARCPKCTLVSSTVNLG